MIEHPGAAVLYRSATGLEKAMADADAERWLERVRAELITENLDAWAVQSRNIKYLAHALATPIWDEEWSEATQRRWLAGLPRFFQLVGTLDAMRLALAPWGYEIAEAVRPPQGFYASPELTREEQEAWLALMPQMRVYFGGAHGTFGIDEWFACPDPEPGHDSGVGFADASYVSLNDGWALWGRKAVIRHLGVDTPVITSTETRTIAGRVAVVHERASIPGSAPLGFCEGDFVGDERFVCHEVIKPKLYTFNVDRTYSHRLSNLQLNTLAQSLDPLEPRSFRNSDIGDGGPLFFACDHSDDGFAGPDDAALMLADVITLHDPDVAAPMTHGISFADADRIGLPVKTVLVRLDQHLRDPLPAFYADIATVGEEFAIPEDTRHLDRAHRAIMAAKPLRTTVLIDFATVKPLTVGDPITELTQVTDWFAEAL